MPIDLQMLSKKISNYRLQFSLSISDVSLNTGISEERLNEFEGGLSEPSGDEILILADFYKCDYKYFISNEKLAPFEQTNALFRRYGNEFNITDRWAIQEILFLAECEYFLDQQAFKEKIHFEYIKQGSFYKKHGIDAAAALRNKLGYAPNVIPLDVFSDFRKIGIYVFRRKLENSNISGLYIKHPKAGHCVLINFNEDIFRQRFTAAHEAAHAIFDSTEEIVVSFTGIKWDEKDLKEVRANNFAASYLVPDELLNTLLRNYHWTQESVKQLSVKLKVNPKVLAIVLKGNKIITNDGYKLLQYVKIPQSEKQDPELSGKYSTKILDRKKMLLEKGLSHEYVIKCINAYSNGLISAQRMAEMILCDEKEFNDILSAFNVDIEYGY